jgi:hypothetical protein
MKVLTVFRGWRRIAPSGCKKAHGETAAAAQSRPAAAQDVEIFSAARGGQVADVPKMKANVAAKQYLCSTALQQDYSMARLAGWLFRLKLRNKYIKSGLRMIRTSAGRRSKVL